jgi:hypothetical protein
MKKATATSSAMSVDLRDEMGVSTSYIPKLRAF